MRLRRDPKKEDFLSTERFRELIVLEDLEIGNEKYIEFSGPFKLLPPLCLGIREPAFLGIDFPMIRDEEEDESDSDKDLPVEVENHQEAAAQALGYDRKCLGRSVSVMLLCNKNNKASPSGLYVG
jgi:hypothetical protein